MYPWQLSGGQQQRVALARVLATSPDILLLDEPFSAWDYHLRSNMERELLNILEGYEGNIIFVTHDIKEAYRISDNIVIFDKGKSISNRKKEELFKNPKCLIEAKLTGCKNISKVTKISKNIMYAKDWGYEFKINYEENKEYKYLGIREHNIKVVKINDDFNIKSFKVSKIINNPFSNTIYVVNKKNENCKYIKFDISKEEVFFEIGDEILLEFNENNMFIF